MHVILQKKVCFDQKRSHEVMFLHKNKTKNTRKYCTEKESAFSVDNFSENEIKRCDMFLSFPYVMCSLKQSLHHRRDFKNTDQTRNRHVHLELMFFIISRTETTHQRGKKPFRDQRSRPRSMLRETAVHPGSNIPRHRCILGSFTESLPYLFLNRESFLTHILLVRRQAHKNNEIKDRIGICSNHFRQFTA